MPKAIALLFSLLSLCCALTAGSPYLQLSSTGSLVRGASVNFSAYLWDHYPDKPGADAEYIYRWSDNANPPNEFTDRTRNHFSNWSVEYSADGTQPGTYRVICEVERYFVFWFNVAVNHVDFIISEDIIGDIQVIQDGSIIKSQWVSTSSPVKHSLALRDNDRHYLLNKATDVKVYWFQNCSYLGMSNSLSYESVYAEEGDLEDIEAILVASFEKIPEPIPSTTPFTTTTTTTTSTTTSTTTTTTTTTTLEPPTTTNKKSRNAREIVYNIKDKNFRTIHDNAAILGVNLSISNTNKPPLFHHKDSSQSLAAPYDCHNKKYIAHDPKKTYGYFQRRLVAINPITNFTVNGKNWLQHGETVNLDINCKGTTPVERCILIYNAPYNATGNEICGDFFKETTCNIKFFRYFSESKSVLFFIRNPVSRTVNQVTINIYEVKKASQLSVVVVPVSFTLIAVICIIFGVAFYLQGRNRFTVEVADFNFGNTQPLYLEDKTFCQRLLDSVCETLPRIRRSFSQSSSENGSEMPSPIDVPNNVECHST